jgi:hypothetical protein
LGTEPEHNFENRNKGVQYRFVGEVVGVKDKLNIIRVHNVIFLDDIIEAISPLGNVSLEVKKIYDDKMREVSEAHGGHEKKYYFEFNKILEEKTLLRVASSQRLLKD